jgi:hypothetical protein
MEKFCIRCFNSTVKFTSDVPLKDYFEKNKNQMEFYNGEIYDYNQFETKYELVYINKESLYPIIYDHSRLIVICPFEKISESIILYLGYHLMEYQFGLDGKSSCHSACVIKNNKALLLLGDAGAGKTSVAINMCKNNGYSLMSNDMTLIGVENKNLYAYGGTKNINLRYGSVEQNMPYLIPYFKGKIDDIWNYKISVQASNIGLDENYEKTQIIGAIYLKVNNQEKDLTITPGDNWRNNFSLYNNLSSHIRGTSATFIDKFGHPLGYIPSFDSLATYEFRKIIIELIDKSKFYNVSGNLQNVINFADGIMLDEKELIRKLG